MEMNNVVLWWQLSGVWGAILISCGNDWITRILGLVLWIGTGIWWLQS